MLNMPFCNCLKSTKFYYFNPLEHYISTHYLSGVRLLIDYAKTSDGVDNSKL